MIYVIFTPKQAYVVYSVELENLSFEKWFDLAYFTVFKCPSLIQSWGLELNYTEHDLFSNW